MTKVITHIHTPTNDVQQSIDFYQKLQYQQLNSEPSILFSDGKMIIEINPDRFARAGLIMYQENWEAECDTLAKITTVIDIEDGHLVSDPNGVRVYLMNQIWDKEYDLPETGKTYTGNFAGVSIEATDLKRSQQFWEALGYQHTQGAAEQGWMAFSNGSAIDISLMKSYACPHLFFNPSMTFFNGKENNPILIEKIRAANIPIAEEITVFNKEGMVDNIIIRDPGGYGFFIFND